jgi:tRNA wybutosine-synthesizing protein 3
VAGVATSWEEEKARAWARLWEDLEIGYLDTDILDVLVEIFLRPDSFSVSSCSGRITVLDADYPWSKEEGATVFKKHEPITVSELRSVLARPITSRLWLSVQGPIYHVYTRSMEEAEKLLSIAREAGFKHSGILVPGEHPLVELRTGVRADMLLAADGQPVVAEDKLEMLVSIANDVLAQAKERNRRLFQALRRNRPERLWDEALKHPLARRIAGLS